jgi:hypothetical protein
MGAFENAQRANVASQLAAGKITQAQANSALAGIASAEKSNVPYTGSGSSTYPSTISGGGSQGKTSSSSSGSTPSYQAHIDYFGSPEKYAATINQKGWQNLDDPAAAGAFMKDYPGLFETKINQPIQPDPNNIYDRLLSQYGQPINVDAYMEKYLSRLPQLSQSAPRLSSTEAKIRAEEQLSPLYKETLDKALEEVDRSNIRRGFFGQLPGAALSRSTAADIETRKAQAIGQLTNQLVGQSEESARAQEALALQQYNAQANNIMNAFRAAQDAQQEQRSNLLVIANTLAAARRAEDEKKFREAGITGTWNGQPTWERQQAERADAYKRERDSISDERYNQEWPYKQRAYEYDLNKPYSTGGAKGPSDSDIKRENLATAQGEIWNMLDRGTPIEQVEAWIIKNASKYSAGGLDPFDLVDYAWYTKTGAKKPKQQGTGQEDVPQLMSKYGMQ